jgi:hypothetical protein
MDGSLAKTPPSTYQEFFEVAEAEGTGLKKINPKLRKKKIRFYGQKQKNSREEGGRGRA